MGFNSAFKGLIELTPVSCTNTLECSAFDCWTIINVGLID